MILTMIFPFFLISIEIKSPQRKPEAGGTFFSLDNSLAHCRQTFCLVFSEQTSAPSKL